jgi:ADP-dependent NAD(P)H-hydrate dehydratase / NAD(P)H-hydrate epimerase
MMKILTADQMRTVEQKCALAGTPAGVLMENAGRAVAEAIRNQTKNPGLSILVLVGPGNNGGDGLVAGRYLRTYGFGVNFYSVGSRPDSDVNVILAREHGLSTTVADRNNLDRLEQWLSSTDIVLDALLGTGKSRPVSGFLSDILKMVRVIKNQRPEMRIVALDLPSGLDADTGAVDPACLYVDETITLGFPKPGLFIMPGAERAGKITIVDIGIPHNLAESDTELLTDDMVKMLLPSRPLISNKGTFGKVLVIAGSVNYIGAAYLACSGAIRVGTGLVTLAVPSSLLPILAVKLTETTYLPLPDSRPGEPGSEAIRILVREIENYQTVLIGPGLGRNSTTAALIESLIFGKYELVTNWIIDADALNALSMFDTVSEMWQRLSGDAILTPHPGEMSRLTAMTVDRIQSDRLGLAKKKAKEWHKTIVLKGAYTVIASPDGQVAVSPFANPGLASAGTGDVLAGVIAGLVAQHIPLFNAAAAGVYIHGKAGENVKFALGDTGMTASDLLPVLPQVIRSIKDK